MLLYLNIRIINHNFIKRIFQEVLTAHENLAFTIEAFNLIYYEN